MASKPITEPLPFIHPDDMPDLYALEGRGTCLQPRYNDGDLLVMDKREKPQKGDAVVVTFTREHAALYGAPGWVKLLGLNLPPSDVPGLSGLVVLDQVNPPRRYAIPSDHVLAVHKVIGAGTRSDRPGEVLLRMTREG